MSSFISSVIVGKGETSTSGDDGGEFSFAFVVLICGGIGGCWPIGKAVAFLSDKECCEASNPC